MTLRHNSRQARFRSVPCAVGASPFHGARSLVEPRINAQEQTAKRGRRVDLPASDRLCRLSGWPHGRDAAPVLCTSASGPEVLGSTASAIGTGRLATNIISVMVSYISCPTMLMDEVMNYNCTYAKRPKNTYQSW